MKTSYNQTERDCQYLHGFNSTDLKKFIKLAELSEGMNVLDAMCGDGVISKEIEKTKGVNLFLLDNSKSQIKRAKKNVQKAEFYVSSVLNMPFEEESFDRVFIRSGIYEVPKNKQIELYKEVYRVLKNNGMFLIWTCKLNERNVEWFNKIARIKDKLAGYSDLVKNRYFMSQKELEKDLVDAGFSYEFKNLDIFYNISTKRWCEIDFKGDKVKLNKLNEYIRKFLLNIPNIEVKDIGEDIKITVPALICVARKREK